MLRNFTAALIATALVAGPALAAQPSSNAGAAPAAPAVAAAPAAPANIKGQNAIKQTDVRKPVKTGQARADPSSDSCAPRADLWPPSRRPRDQAPRQARQGDQDQQDREVVCLTELLAVRGLGNQ